MLWQLRGMRAAGGWPYSLVSCDEKGERNLKQIPTCSFRLPYSFLGIQIPLAGF